MKKISVSINELYKKWYFENPKALNMLCGGRNTGKSYFGATLCILNSLKNICNSVAMRRTSLTAQRDTALLIIGVGKLILKNDFEKIFTYQPSYNRFKNNLNDKFILVRGIGRQVEDLKSFGEIKFLWIDEATNFTDLEMETLIPSIKDRHIGASLLLTSNIPASKRHWIYKFFIHQNTRLEDSKYLLSSFKDNPYIDQKKYLIFMNSLFKKGSNAYTREVLGQIPEFSNNYLIYDYEIKLVEAKFKMVFILLKLIASEVFILVVAFKNNEFFILNEYKLESLKSFYEVLNNIINENEKFLYIKTSENIKIFTSKDDYKILYHSFKSNNIILNLYVNKKPLKLEDLRLFNFNNIKIVIDVNIKALKDEFDIVEWGLDLNNDDLIETLINSENSKFLKVLTLSNSILNY